MALTDVLQNPNSIAVSTSARVLVNGQYIGVVQSLSPSQDRATTAVRGIGTGDRILTRVWQLTDYKLSIKKMALFKAFMFNLMGYNSNFRMLAQLRAPIDIQETLQLPDGTNIRTTWYRGCYITSYSAPREITGDIIVYEDVNLDVTSMDDGLHSPFDYDAGLTPILNQ